MAELRDSEGELPADAVPAEAPATETIHEEGVPIDKGVLYDRCMKRWGKSVAEVNGVLNVKSADDIKDLEWAWSTCLAFWGPEKASNIDETADEGQPEAEEATDEDKVPA